MAIPSPCLKTVPNTKSDCMESIRQRGTRILETGPNNLPLIWYSENRSGSLKRISIVMAALSGWSMWGMYASMKRWLKLVLPGFTGNIVQWRSAGAGWNWNQWPEMGKSVCGRIQIHCHRGSFAGKSGHKHIRHDRKLIKGISD